MTETELEKDIQHLMGDINYDASKLFPNRDTFLGKRQTKKRMKLISTILPALPSILEQNEQIIYVSKGNTSSGLEQLFAGGVVAYYSNMTTIIVTNTRIILINTKRNGKQKLYRNFIPFSEIKKAKIKAFFTSVLKLKDGKKVILQGIIGRDKKIMQQYINDAMARHHRPTRGKSLHHLCPHCSFTVTEIVKNCGNCGTQFKSVKKASLLSLFLPGLGDMYLGHHLFGFCELAGSLLLWVVLLSAFIAGLNNPEINDEEFGTSLGIIMGVILVSHVADYILTRQMGKKGLIAATSPTNSQMELYLG